MDECPDPELRPLIAELRRVCNLYPGDVVRRFTIEPLIGRVVLDVSVWDPQRDVDVRAEMAARGEPYPELVP